MLSTLLEKLTKIPSVCTTRRFYKENNLWYIDLPEFLAAGLGSKANLLMVDGADTFLDELSKQTGEVVLEFSNNPLPDENTCVLKKQKMGLNKEYLDKIGHAPVDYGAYYDVVEMNNSPYHHMLWLCPVAEYVFQGGYPDKIYVRFVGCGKNNPLVQEMKQKSEDYLKNLKKY